MSTIFVFGSNLRGRHGAGSAEEAVKRFGAEEGVGVGRTGNAYAIPTKDARLRTLPLSRIRPYVKEFLDYAATHSDLNFVVVEIGCGLAGYQPHQIAPFFIGAPSNVILPASFDLRRRRR